MIPASDHQPCLRHLLDQNIERFNHQLQALVGSPFSKCEDAVSWIAASREIGKLRPARENSVRPQVHIITSIFVVQDLAIARHEHRNGVGEQKHPGSNRTGKTVQLLMPNAHVLEFNRVHQVMKSHVGITAAQTRQQGRHQSGEGNEWIPPEGAEQQVEPHDVRLQLMQGLQQTVGT